MKRNAIKKEQISHRKVNVSCYFGVDRTALGMHAKSAVLSNSSLTFLRINRVR